MEETEVSYFFDTYAIAEILEGSPNYQKYINEQVTITIFNLAEIYGYALGEHTQQEADEIYQKYQTCVVEVEEDTLKEAVKFRKENKKKNLSYTDCIGYIYSKRHNMRFLTGDKEFQFQLRNHGLRRNTALEHKKRKLSRR